jgi:hypothetical protein
MQNEPNFPDTQMNVYKVITKDYENISNWILGENEPNTNPIKANTKPIQTQYKANQTQTKPISKQLRSPICLFRLLINRINRICLFRLLINRINRICCLCSFSVSSILPKWHYIRIIQNSKKAVKKFNFLKYKQLNSQNRLRPLTGTLFALSNMGITILTNS